MYIGAPSEAAPLGDTYTEQYNDVVSYGFDPDERKFAVRYRRNGTPRTVEYPDHRVIRVTVADQ